MSFYSAKTISEITEVARIFRITVDMSRGWNENRRGSELRLLTGWTWAEKHGERRTRTGFKTQSAAMRDAYYVLLQHREQPADVRRPTMVRVTTDERQRRTA